MERSSESKRGIITKKVKTHPNFWNRYQSRTVSVKLRANVANETPTALPDGTLLLTEEENRQRQAGTGSQAAHIAQADEIREEQKTEATQSSSSLPSEGKKRKRKKKQESGIGKFILDQLTKDS